VVAEWLPSGCNHQHMILDTYYVTDVPGLYIDLALGRLDNDITISLDDAGASRVVWDPTWSHAVRGGSAPPGIWKTDKIAHQR